MDRLKVIRLAVILMLQCGWFSVGPELVTSQIVSYRCPTYWTAWGDHCYRYFPDQINWNDAELKCNNIGVIGFGENKNEIGHLTSIHSAEENLFLLNFARSYLTDVVRSSWNPLIHIGLRVGPSAATQLSWTDGSPVDYLNWHSSQPNEWSSPNTITIMSDGNGKNGLWADNPATDNSYVYSLICKIPQAKMTE